MKQVFGVAALMMAAGLTAACGSRVDEPALVPAQAETRGYLHDTTQASRVDEPTYIKPYDAAPLPVQRVMFDPAASEFRQTTNHIRRFDDFEDEQPIPLFSHVQSVASALSETPYKAPAPAPDVVKQLSYDDYRKIGFKREATLFAESGAAYQMALDSRGSLFQTPVKINLVSETGQSVMGFDPAKFDFSALDLTEEQKASFGYAGFRLLTPLNTSGKFDEVLSVKGASFFRALGVDNHYGASARGLAIGTASPDGEEFPVFREFWIQEPQPGDQNFVFHALLDGPSVTGAYQFRLRPGAETQMEVTAVLYARKDTSRIGLAPLTSMFEFAPHDPDRDGQDFRPRVHDSEGLSVLLENGEWIWRPLSNPETLKVSSFTSDIPRGFGLLQRNRDFDQYEDMEAAYEVRPSVWVTPTEGWRDGELTLVEIPSPNEYNDNIVAYWKLRDPLSEGQTMRFSYRMDWGMKRPLRSPVSEVLATRVGQSEQTGEELFVIDFAIPPNTSVEDLTADLSASSGTARVVSLRMDDVRNRVRLTVELSPEAGSDSELRAVLKQGERVASETWLFRWSAA
ncbi:MAG: glucan biosynthesis protein D [Ponticaulis sp.]|nr:glucan biosynthesis protein D [Ponticaulis sp.]|tara:strand:+ start:14737 stop:16443 length:1707 start_codon:yes stop_codon:yes gene_type:complete